MANYPIYRLVKGSELTFSEMDGNLEWLSRTLSASVVEITGSTIVKDSLSIKGITSTNQSNVVTVDTATGQLYYTASSAIGGVTGPIAASGSVIYTTTPKAGTPVPGEYTENSILFGSASGDLGEDISKSNMIGWYSGYKAKTVFDSNILGYESMYSSSNASSINAIGYRAGKFSQDTFRGNFIGSQAGANSSRIFIADFIGDQAGIESYEIRRSVFAGYLAGYRSSNTEDTVMIGSFAGAHSKITSSICIGNVAGTHQGSSSYSIFIGYKAGSNGQPGIEYSKGLLTNNIVIGSNITLRENSKDCINIGGLIFGTGSYSNVSAAGEGFSGSAMGRIGINQPFPSFSLDVSGSGRYTNGLVVTSSLIAPNITGSLLGTASFAQTAMTSSYPITVTGSTVYTNHVQNSPFTFNATYGVFLAGAGWNANRAQYSTFIGSGAGNFATFAEYSNFLSTFAGYQATSASYSNFFGDSAGYQATNASQSNFLGRLAGQGSTNAHSSNFLGVYAGYSSANGENSNFIGFYAGYQATNASFSNLLGYRSGYNTGGPGIGSNNIIIGTNITLTSSRKDSINIGGLIFGTGSYSTTTGNPFSGSANGRIGINQPFPSQSLDVSGSVQISQALILPPFHPLPSQMPSGSIMSSGSDANCKPYFWNGLTWTALF